MFKIQLAGTVERGVQRNPRVQHQREAGCLLIVRGRKGTTDFQQDIYLRIIRQRRGTAAHLSMKVCGNCQPCFTLCLSPRSALCKKRSVTRRLLGRMSVAGEGKCPGTLILPSKKGFTKSKGGERGKKKMGEFEDELASCMMNPKMFDCEELEPLSGW